ncbi:MAG: SDR family oxidoreductase [Lachnoclostridium sp.]|nr:SDR family oxidoreductase [Lachnospira sp.]MCM1247303.1 SDR family oxidoreductase [Lachnoclostridium sp.]MCM1534395.1 SDR family oxidoreductase [Clostridium sp.]
MLQGKNAVITGSNRGIGKATAEVFAANGCNLWVCARREQDEFWDWCRNLSKEKNVRVEPLFFDFMDDDGMHLAFDSIKKSGIPVDILVNVAGAVFNANYLMTQKNKLEELFNINYFSQVQWTQYIIKLMRKQKKGSIVNVTSSGAIDGNAGRTAYNASKAAIISTTKTMARELGIYGIRVNAIAPGLTDTDMARDYTPEEIMTREIESSSLKRIGKPEEIANVIAFLASDLSSYVTGQTWRVDGGM